jgi:hypothetical protein
LKHAFGTNRSSAKVTEASRMSCTGRLWKGNFVNCSIGILQKQRRKNMNNKSIAKPSIAAVLALTAVLAPAWAQPSLPAQNSGAEQTLTGTVGDSKCKGQTIDRKAVTLLSCTHICTHSEGRDYVLRMGNSVYVLVGHRNDLDKFGGGRATVTGRLDGNTILVDSVSSVKKQG